MRSFFSFLSPVNLDFEYQLKTKPADGRNHNPYLCYNSEKERSSIPPVASKSCIIRVESIIKASEDVVFSTWMSVACCILKL